MTTSGAHPGPLIPFVGGVGDDKPLAPFKQERTSLLLSTKTVEFRSGSLEPGAGVGGDRDSGKLKHERNTGMPFIYLE